MNELEWYHFVKHAKEVSKKGKELLETLKDLSESENWPETIKNDKRKLIFYAKIKGLLNREEYELLRDEYPKYKYY